MTYNKKAKVGYGNRKNKLPKKTNVVLALEGGHLCEVHVIMDPRKAKANGMNLPKSTTSQENSTRKVTASSARTVARVT